MLFLLWFQQLTGWTLKKKSKWKRERATLTAGFYFNQFFFVFKNCFQTLSLQLLEINLTTHTQADLKMKMMCRFFLLVIVTSFRSLAFSLLFLLAVLHTLTLSVCFNPIIFRSLFSNDGHLIKKNFVESSEPMYWRTRISLASVRLIFQLLQFWLCFSISAVFSKLLHILKRKKVNSVRWW